MSHMMEYMPTTGRLTTSIVSSPAGASRSQGSGAAFRMLPGGDFGNRNNRSNNGTPIPVRANLPSIITLVNALIDVPQRCLIRLQEHRVGVTASIESY